MPQQITTSTELTLRTCLQMFAYDAPAFYVTGATYWGVGDWEPGRLIAHLEESNGGMALLARPATMFDYHWHDPKALRETAVAGIFLLSEQEGVEQREVPIIAVYHLFSLAHFRAFIANPVTSLQYTPQQWQKWPPLLAYAGIAFGISLEIVADSFQVYYRRTGGTALAGFPLWAVLLHRILMSIQGIDESVVQAVDWKETILVLLPLIERIAPHTDWTGLRVPVAGNGRK